MTAAMYDYKDYKITVREGQFLTDAVSVFDPQFKRLPPVYKTTSLDEAMRWVDANPKTSR